MLCDPPPPPGMKGRPKSVLNRPFVSSVGNPEAAGLPRAKDHPEPAARYMERRSGSHRTFSFPLTLL